MHSAIGSRKDFNNLDEDQLLAEYKVCLEGLLEHEQVLKLDLHTQHCNTSRLQHSINVSYYSFLICYKMGWDYHSAARAGLLHDLYFYDWRVKKYIRSSHSSWHPRIALLNAQKITKLNKVEMDAIRKHMWPCTLIPPVISNPMLLPSLIRFVLSVNLQNAATQRQQRKSYGDSEEALFLNP